MEEVSRKGWLTTTLTSDGLFRLNIFCSEMSFSGRVHSWLIARMLGVWGVRMSHRNQLADNGTCPIIVRISFSLKPKDRSTSIVGLSDM